MVRTPKKDRIIRQKGKLIMKRFFVFILALLMLLGAFASCGSETPSGVPGSSAGDTSGNEASQTLEPITDVPDTADLFEGAEPLPADLVIPEAVKSADGTVIGTIVVPAGADATETTAAEELRFHIQKVTGAELPIVGRPGEEYGSLIVCSPASFPAVGELFPDDIAWLADTGDPEAGARWCSDGFAIRTLGKDIYIFGNISRGALNGAYDWIEENLGVLWVRADEDLGLIYEEQPEVTVLKTDYREKSPFEIRGWIPGWSSTSTALMWSRNKLNFNSANALHAVPVGGYIKSLLQGSPLYDPEETEYWNTDEEGNRLSPSASPHVNFMSEKTVEVIAAACVEQLKSGYYAAFVGEEDNVPYPHQVPEENEPFEYAPGQFVEFGDENYLSTVFMTFINKVARKVKETIPDGKIGTYVYGVANCPPACEIEDNVILYDAVIKEDMCNPLDSDVTRGKPMEYALTRYGDWLRTYAEKTKNISMYNYYGCWKASNRVTRPIWDRIQADFQHYVSLGLIGVSSEGVGDTPGKWDWADPDDQLFPSHGWDLNGMIYWIYSKLAWNPWEDVSALIVDYCDKVYGDASGYMQDYYRLIKEGWDSGTATYRAEINHHTTPYVYYKYFVKDSGKAHEMLDALNLAYDAVSGPMKEVIGYMRDTFTSNMNAFRKW